MGLNPKDDVITWLSGVLDEDERLARVASPGPWSPNAEGDEVMAVDGERVADGFALSGNQLRNTVSHIVRHDPAAVLADIAAKRRILGLLNQIGAMESQVEMEFGVGAVDPSTEPSEMIPRLLASAYADRLGYRQEWAP